MDKKLGKISSDLKYLEELHNKFYWIPGKEQIRPNKEIIDKKEKDMINIIPFYNSYLDYIYDIIFNCNMKINNDGKLEVNEFLKTKYIFRKNDYPYQVNTGTHHYIIWYNQILLLLLLLLFLFCQFVWVFRYCLHLYIHN